INLHTADAALSKEYLPGGLVRLDGGNPEAREKEPSAGRVGPVIDDGFHRAGFTADDHRHDPGRRAIQVLDDGVIPLAAIDLDVCQGSGRGGEGDLAVHKDLEGPHVGGVGSHLQGVVLVISLNDEMSAAEVEREARRGPAQGGDTVRSLEGYLAEQG